MDNAVFEERRSYVRGNLSFKVKFRVITQKEYETLKEAINQSSPPENMSLDDAISKESIVNTFIIDFLLNIDEKLDQVISKLTKDEDSEELLKHGICSDISGSGMSITVDTLVECGQIIHANFILARLPLVYLDAFGEIVRVIPVDENEQSLYKLGVKFLELNTNAKERIISCVFQKQRENIRKSKDKEVTNG